MLKESAENLLGKIANCADENKRVFESGGKLLRCFSSRPLKWRRPFRRVALSPGFRADHLESGAY